MISWKIHWPTYKQNLVEDPAWHTPAVSLWANPLSSLASLLHPSEA